MRRLYSVSLLTAIWFSSRLYDFLISGSSHDVMSSFFVLLNGVLNLKKLHYVHSARPEISTKL